MKMVFSMDHSNPINTILYYSYPDGHNRGAKLVLLFISRWANCIVQAKLVSLFISRWANCIMHNVGAKLVHMQMG